MTNLKMFQTLAGQEIIGKLIEETHTSIVLQYPLTVKVIPQTNEQYGLGFVPYSMTSPDGTHKFNRGVMLSEPVDIPSVLETGYVKYTSGIEIVSSLGQIGG